MPAVSPLILVVGDNAAVDEVVASPELPGVTAVAVPGGPDVVQRVRDLGPDLVVVGYDEADGKTGDVVRQLRAQPGERPPVVVIGAPEGVDRPGSPGSGHAQAVTGEEYLPADVSTSDLIDRIRSRLTRPAARAAGPRRPSIPPPRLNEELGRELQRAEYAGRQGILAAVTVAELSRLHERLGSEADQVIAAAFDELFALDARLLEQHSARPDGGFWLLMPETDAEAARERLEQLAWRGWHGLVRQSPGRFLPDAAVVVIISVLAGWLSYTLIERPTSQLGRVFGPDGHLILPAAADPGDHVEWESFRSGSPF